MGPQPNSCGNRRNRSSISAASSLQWGHSQTAVETTIVRLKGGSVLALQWGHSQTAVETNAIQASMMDDPNASMGPQPNSCGNSAQFVEIQTCHLALQWGHSQTAVETIPARPCHCHLVGFNGATAKQLWKHADRHRSSVIEFAASMGPQPNSCGNPTERRSLSLHSKPLQWGHSQTAVETWYLPLHQARSFWWLQWGHSQTAVETRIEFRHVDDVSEGFNGATAKQLWKQPKHARAKMTPPLRFNGATAKQLWKRARSRTRRQDDMSFNGATAKQLWKRAGARRFVLPAGTLQWGHSQTAVETPVLVGAADLDRASMGPQPNSCGNLCTLR